MTRLNDRSMDEFYRQYMTGCYNCDNCYFRGIDSKLDTSYCTLTKTDVFDEIHLGGSPTDCPLKHPLIYQYLEHDLVTLKPKNSKGYYQFQY